MSGIMKIKIIVFVILCSISVDSFSDSTSSVIVTPTNSRANPAYTYNTRPWIIFYGTTNDGYQVNDAEVGFWDGTSWINIYVVSAWPAWGSPPTSPASFYPMPANSGQYIRYRTPVALPTGKNLTVTVWTCTANPTAGTRVTASASVVIYIKPTAWTDSTINAGTTRIKAAHFTQLRTAINEVRNTRNLANSGWTNTLTAGVSQVKAADLTELRTVLTPAFNAATGTDPSGTTAWTDSTITAGSTQIKKAHIDDLRDRAAYP